MNETFDEQGVRDEQRMRRALQLSDCAAAQGEVPIGAVLVNAAGKVIGEGWNQPISACDPTAHAEIIALRAAARAVGNYRLPGTTLYVTVEPCTMCTGALLHSRIERLVIATLEPKAGAVISHDRLLDAPNRNHRVRYEAGLCAHEASEKMSLFFKQRRREKKTTELD
ncbi:MAG: tRNA adenosine(34) deaminase TadA [Cellvibrionaceae bacterium]